MSQPHRVEPKRTERTERIAFRVEPDEARAVQQVADRLFEGNVSMLARVALRQYVTALEAETLSERGQVA